VKNEVVWSSQLLYTTYTPQESYTVSIKVSCHLGTQDNILFTKLAFNKFIEEQNKKTDTTILEYLFAMENP
jgi:hypothetical protein